MIRHFQDAKSDYELEEGPETRAELCSAIQCLLCFEKVQARFQFENIDTLDKRISPIDSSFESFSSRLKTEFESKIEELQQSMEYKLVDEKQFLSVLKRDSTLTRDHTLLGAETRSELAAFFVPLKMFRKKLLRSLSPVSEESGIMRNPRWLDGVDYLFRFQDYPRTIERCHFMKRHSWCIFEKFNSKTTVLKLTNLESHFYLSPKKKLISMRDPVPRLHSAFQTLAEMTANLGETSDQGRLTQFDPNELNGVIDKLVVSPSDNYVGVKLTKDQNYCLYSTGTGSIEKNKSLTRLDFIGDLDIRDFCFVDSPGSEKIVFVNGHRTLHVVDLGQSQLEFRSDGSLGFLSVYYVDPENVLVLTVEFEFAMLSLGSKSLSDRVSLEANFTEASPESQMLSNYISLQSRWGH